MKSLGRVSNSFPLLFSPDGAGGQGSGFTGHGNKMEGGLGCAWPRSITRRLGGEGEERSRGIWLSDSRCGGVGGAL